MTYPRPLAQQKLYIDSLRQCSKISGNSYDKPVLEPIYIDLIDDDNAPATPIHLGYRMGVKKLRDYLHSRQFIGVNHVALNLRFNKNNIEKTLKKIVDEVLPDFVN